MFCIRVFFVFSFSAFQRIQTKKDSRLSQDSYLYINLISIMKNNSYSVHARLHDCSLSKRAMSAFIALIYRGGMSSDGKISSTFGSVCERKKTILDFAGSLILLNFVGEEGFLFHLYISY